MAKSKKTSEQTRKYVAKAWADIKALQALIKAQKAKIADREAQIAAIKSSLVPYIKPGKVISDVMCYYKKRTSVSYKEITERIVEQFVPKTKQPEIPSIIDGYTKTTETLDFKQVKT